MQELQAEFEGLYNTYSNKVSQSLWQLL